MKKLLSILFLSSLFYSINPQWLWQHPIPPVSHFRSIEMLDNNTVIGAGGESMILKSTDAGNTWHRKDAGIFAWPEELVFADQNTGWILGYPYNILKTTNRGDNWFLISTFTDNLFDMTFTDINTGWACGWQHIYKTTNGGNYWSDIYYSPQVYLNSIFFVNSAIGWSVGTLDYSAVVIKTLDGGNSWTSYPLPYVPDMEDLYFIDANTGFAVGSDGALSGNNGFIWKTTDGGASWDTSFAGFRFVKIKFINSSTGFALGAEGLILKTTDSGNSWFSIPSGTTKSLSSITMSSSGYGFIGGSEGIILKTTDFGNSWSIIADPPIFNIYSIDFCDRYHGAAVGQYGKILITTNGGNQWELNTYAAPAWSMLSVSYIAPSFIWASGWDGTIVHSSDGGNDWILQNTGVGVPLRSICFVNNNTGWAAGNNGIILKTTNGGTNWYALNTQTTEWFKTIHFVNENYGWAAGQYDLLKKTTDGGLTWQDLTLSGYHSFYSIFFINEYNGWVSIGPGILKTTNAGSSWTPGSLTGDSFINDIYFKNADTGWAAGRHGEIWSTTNGGTNWTLQTDDIYDELYSIANCETNELWISGNSSLILYSVDGNIPVELNNLYITTDGNKVNIRWSTSSETNNKGFEVERQLDNKGWTTIGFVPGQGTTAEEHQYNFEDKISEPGKYLYRLKQIDLNGTFTYSEEMEVSISTPAKFNLEQNFPNPFNPATKIAYTIPEYTKVTIKILDVLGNEIETIVNEEKPAGQYAVNWNASYLPSGVYFYQLRAGSFTETKKMILMK